MDRKNPRIPFAFAAANGAPGRLESLYVAQGIEPDADNSRCLLRDLEAFETRSSFFVPASPLRRSIP